MTFSLTSASPEESNKIKDPVAKDESMLVEDSQMLLFGICGRFSSPPAAVAFSFPAFCGLLFSCCRNKTKAFIAHC